MLEFPLAYWSFYAGLCTVGVYGRRRFLSLLESVKENLYSLEQRYGYTLKKKRISL